MCHWFLFFANRGFAFEAVVFLPQNPPLILISNDISGCMGIHLQLAPGAGPRTPVHACVRLHMEGWTWRAFHTCITQVVSIYKYWDFYSNFMFMLYSHITFFCQYWCQRWRWKAHHLRLELARAEQALCAVWSCVISWPLATNILIAADIVHWNYWSSFYSIHQSMLMAAWHPGWRAHREAAVDVQSYFSTTGSPRKDKEIGLTDVRTVMCGWLMPNSLTRYE